MGVVYFSIIPTFEPSRYCKCWIVCFYDSLHLGYETRRLDYLGLQLEGKYQSEKDEKRKIKLGESLSILLKKRNRMTVTGRSL